MLGLDTRNASPENLLRSAVEGATFALRFGIDELEGLGISTEQVVLTGGGAKSPTWRQVVADICAVRRSSCSGRRRGLRSVPPCRRWQCSTMPAMNYRRWSLDHLERDEGRSLEPRPSAASFYQDTYSRYQQAVDKVAELYG